jgi:methyl-accepting chemotaxis protein
MKLGTKILLGFISLILIAMLLGGIAVWKMSRVNESADSLATEFLPATAVANNVERESLATMYEMRGYAFTEDTNMLARSLVNLDEVKQFLKDAKALSLKSGDADLVFLNKAAEKAEAQVLEYENLAKQTVAATEGLDKNRLIMNQAAQDYMKVADEFVHDQEGKLQELLKANNAGTALNVANIEDCVKKMQFMNDVIEVGNAIRIGNFKSQANRDPELFRETEKKFAQLPPLLDGLKAITKDAEHLQLIERCRAAGLAYEQAMGSFLENWLMREELGKKRAVAATAVLEAAKQTALTSMDTSTKYSLEATHSLSMASKTMITGLIIAAILGIAMAIVLIRSITGVLRQISSSLFSGAEQTVSAAAQVSSASQSLAEGSSQQASSLEETSSSLEQMSSMTRRNSENAQKVNELGKQAREAADRGVSDMQTMSAAMEAIKISSDDIAKIIKTIDEIAFQTNILALNAAVEAARAGEAGMGFAVVADEVRNLAQRCAQAAKETSGKIEDAIVKTGQGVEISSKVASALNDIVTKVRQVDDLVTEVAEASREQTDGITQINTAVSQIDKVTQNNAANAEESAAAAEELNAQAETLKQSVSELLQLVEGRHTNVGAGKRPAPVHTLAAAKRNTPMPAKVQTIHNGHGEIHPKTSAAQRRNQIPLENSFQEF